MTDNVEAFHTFLRFHSLVSLEKILRTALARSHYLTMRFQRKPSVTIPFVTPYSPRNGVNGLALPLFLMNFLRTCVLDVILQFGNDKRDVFVPLARFQIGTLRPKMEGFATSWSGYRSVRGISMGAVGKRNSRVAIIDRLICSMH